MGTGYLDSYRSLALLLVVGVGLVTVAFTVGRLLRTSKPSDAKATGYECGLDPVGGDWAQMQIRYFVYAFLYALFAVEAVFLFPWAVIFDRPGFGTTAAAEMGVFIAVVSLGLAYAWRKGVLRWT